MTITEQKPTAETATQESDDDFIVDLDSPEGGGSETPEKVETPSIIVAEKAETPEKPSKTVESATAEDDDDDVEDSGTLTPEEKQHLKAKTQKRIQTLARKARAASTLEQRLSQAEQALKERESKIAELQTANITGQEQNLVSQKAQAQSELEAAKVAWLKADDDGNRKAALDAMEQMTSAKAKIGRLEDFERSFAVRKAKAAKPAEEKPTPADNVNPDMLRRDQARARKWLDENTWADPNSDDHNSVMLGALEAVHRQLIGSEGFNPWSEDPNFGREAYYNELDVRIRKEFPHKFTRGSKPEANSKTPVAGAPRTPVATTKNQVRLTKSEVDLCQRIGVSLKDYALEKQKLQRERGER